MMDVMGNMHPIELRPALWDIKAGTAVCAVTADQL